MRQNKKKRNIKILASVIILIVIFLGIILWTILGKNLDKNKNNTVNPEQDILSEETKDIEKPDSSDEFSTSQFVLSEQSVAIIGDSISAFSEYNSKGYASCYPAGDVQDVSQMWWARVQEATGISFTAVGAYSGGTVTGDSTDTTDGKPSCSDKRIMDLVGSDGREPDIVIIFNGVNDFSGAKPLGDSAAGEEDLAAGEKTNFRDAYALMLTKIKESYPQTRIYCCTLMDCEIKTTLNDNGEYVNEIGLTIDDYNAALREIATYYGADLIETAECGITYETLEDYTYDWAVHPNDAGMELVANAVLKALQR